MRKSYDAKVTRWLDGFVGEIRKEILRRDPNAADELEVFDVCLTAILQEVTADGWASGPAGGRVVPIRALGEGMHLGYRRVVNRLKLAARIGLIKGVTGSRLPLELLLNPALVTALKSGRPDRPLAASFAGIWLDRIDEPGDVQGFETIGKWGEMDEATAIITGHAVDHEASTVTTKKRNYLDEIKAASAGTKEDAQRRRAKDRQDWAALGGAFVTACANIWVRHQAKQGFGAARPAWEGEPTTLSAVNRRARADLVKLLQQYGGRDVGLAWLNFCGSRPEKDDKGKLRFDPNIAHKQWTTPDKRPEAFAKHINLIMAENRKYGWDNDPSFLAKLSEHFGPLADLTPKGQASTQTSATQEAQA